MNVKSYSFQLCQSKLLDLMKDRLQESFSAYKDVTLTESALYLFGGACLHKTLECLQRRAHKKETDPIYLQAMRVAVNITMTTEEKQRLYDRLEETFLRHKDQGNFSLPKSSVLQIIREICRAVEMDANGDVFQLYGAKTVENCLNFMQNQKEKYFQKFLNVYTGQISLNESEEAVKCFFNLWVEKLINLRIDEWYSTQLILDLEKSRKLGLTEGGQSLRQRLYAFVSSEK